MFHHKRSALLVTLALIAPIALAACGAAPEPAVIVETVVVEQTKIVEKEGETITVIEEVTVVETVEVEVEVTAEAPAEEEAEGEIYAYRIALFEDPATTNYWNHLGPGSTMWTWYILDGQAPQLYTLSDVTFQWVPYLATEVAKPVDNGDGTWSITVPMAQDAVWSDGEPITAHDYVFTFNACKDLQLSQSWPNQCRPNGLDATAEAVDDYTLQITFLNQTPSLGNWQNGLSLAPILPEHFWGDVVAESRALIEGLEEPAVAHPADCAAEDLSDEDAAACELWAPVDEAYTNARRTLYEADATGAPTGGGYTTDKLEPGAFAQRTANNEWYLKGAKIEEWDDGTWSMTLPNGESYQVYGEATGEKTLDFEQGPYAPNVIMTIYGSQDAAFVALAAGEVDYVLNPLGLSKGLQEQAEKGEGVESYVNADYGMYYLAFNMRKYPMSEYEFRQAVDIITDKEFVANSVLGGVVFPMYSTMPPGNAFWFNPEAEANPYIGLSRQERVDEAVRVLKEAGWSWTRDPAWDEDLQDVVPGEGITMPNGEPMQEITILGPGPAYDPLRATFNQWISEWMRELGMPVESELSGFNTILGPVFIESTFDMYILGWALGNPAFPNYFESFWHSRNDTAVTGNANTPGYNNPEYDALIDEFMSTADLERARELIFEAQMMLANDRPYLCLFYKQTIDLARDNLIFPYTESLGGLEYASGLQTSVVPLSR
ncbi:MAG: ABC transporter substrate-binding protein [Anaerolineae bacterium]|jgi:ABC-type transport system substrate-binding protein